MYNPVVNQFKTYDDFDQSKIKCRSCDLGKVYDRVISSDGNQKDPVVLIVGEAPGADEIREGRPFVGRSGKLLRSTLNKYGFRKSNSLITNTIPCRPENNKFPSDQDLVISCMSKWLRNEIALVSPKYMLLIGGIPLFYLLAQKGITRLRGKWMVLPSYVVQQTDRTIECLATFHPSYVLRKLNMTDGQTVLDSFEQDVATVAEKARFSRRDQ